VDNATVSIQRATLSGTLYITVAFALRGGRWFFTHILDENGNEIILTETEELLARSLVEAGVDETGR
jgi:hypothetical protein|tara:strand:- start:229 stop:429 length:201 start_codon:yes stop_codon:yes gene_type:complete